MGDLVFLHKWEVFEFAWGTAIRESRTKKWHTLCLTPDGQEIDVSELNVILHDNGIEFV
ncbi:hypothetical protein COHCIP112018_02389 [Cohnella sp. JJ-181]|nr:hypothetical protein COHCIP112018_02389 [Cohnella sp. JJ-181]